MQTSIPALSGTSDRKAASILKDLDPENTRLPASKQGSSNIFVWSVALLLLVAGASWLYLANTFRPRPAEAPAALAAAVPATSASKETSIAEGGSELSATASSAVGAAVIRSVVPEESRQATTAAEMQRDALAAPSKAPAQQESAKAAGVSATAPTMKSVTTAPRQTTNSAKSSQRQAKNSQKKTQNPPSRATSQATERDIEIISAIVK